MTQTKPTRRKATPPIESEPKSAFAVRLGLSRGRVSQMVTAGLPVTADGKVPVGAGLAWVEANIQQAAGGNEDAAALIAARVRLTRAQAFAAELANQVREGELIERSIVSRVVSAAVRLQRDTILNFASRTGPELAAELGVDTRVMVSALDAAMRNLLIEVSNHKMPYHPEEAQDAA